MRTRHIEIFHAVVEEGSVSAAAKRLNVSQPSVTKMLRQAEEDLRYPLFDRVRGRLQLTEEGRALAAEVRRAFAAMDDVHQLSRRLRRGVQTEFRIAAPPAIGHQALPAAIADYVKKSPRARFQISTQHSGSLLAAIGRAAHGYDLGFTFGAHGAPAGVASLDVGEVRLAAVAPTGVNPAHDGPLRFADLNGGRIIALEEEEPLGRMIAEGIRQAGAEVDAPVRVQTYSLACALAIATQAIALVDALTAANFVAGGGDGARGGVAIRAFEPDLRLKVTAVYPIERGLPLAARDLVESFRTALEERNAAIEALLG